MYVHTFAIFLELAVRSQVVSLKIQYKQVFDMLSDNINELKEAIFEAFQENIHQSAVSDMDRQRPVFVLEIMAQNSSDELFHLLKSRTPYCSLFNFLKFIEQIADKLGNKDAKEIIAESKEILYNIKKDDIMSYLEKEYSHKEEFTNVVMQMHKSFKIVTCGEIELHKDLTSSILNQKDLVCFVDIDEQQQTVSYVIPSVLTESALYYANQKANRFSSIGVLCITIGGSKIFSNMSHSIWPYLNHDQSMYEFIAYVYS